MKERTISTINFGREVRSHLRDNAKIWTKVIFRNSKKIVSEFENCSIKLEQWSFAIVARMQVQGCSFSSYFLKNEYNQVGI